MNQKINIESLSVKQAETVKKIGIEASRLLDHLKTSVLLLDIDGTLITANNVLSERTGVSGKNLVGRPIAVTYWFCYNKDVQIRIRNAVNKAARGESVSYRERLRITDGFVNVRLNVKPFVDETGNTKCLILEGYYEITDVAEPERELEVSHYLINAMGIFAGLTDFKGRIEFVNRDSILGFSKREIIGRFFWDIEWFAGSSEEMAEAKRSFNSALEGRQVQKETTVVSKKGDKIPIYYRVTPIFDNKNNLTKIALEAMDIRELKEKEDAIKREREAFSIISRASLYAKSIPELCRRILAGLVETLNFDSGIIRLYDYEKRILQMTASIGVDKEMKNKIVPVYSIDDPEAVTAHVMRTCKPIFAPDLTIKRPDNIQMQRIMGFNLRSIICWPIIADKAEPMGVIHLATQDKKNIDKEDRIFFETVANMFAIVLKRAQARKEIEASLKEKEILLQEVKKKEASIMRERKAFSIAAEAFVYAKNIKDLCRRMLVSFLETINFDSGTIRLYDSKEKILRPEVVIGMDLKDIPPYHIDDPTALSPHVAHTRKPVFAPDAEKHEIFKIFKTKFKKFNRKAFISWPILDDEQHLLGVLQIFDHNPKKITEKERIFFETIARMFTVALQREQSRIKLENSLKEKEMLLNEIHHRVKNNMQVVSSLLNLQSKYAGKKELEYLFKESRDRIKSMALVHEQLYQSKDLAGITFSEYIKHLADSLFRSYRVHPGKISLIINAGEVALGIDRAVPCGLIINELVSNALKYAFIEMEQGEIRVELHPENSGKFTLSIADNGIGFPQDIDFRNSSSFGLRLVIMLVKQIGGTIELCRDIGTTFKLRF